MSWGIVTVFGPGTRNVTAFGNTVAVTILEGTLAITIFRDIVTGAIMRALQLVLL